MLVRNTTTSIQVLSYHSRPATTKSEKGDAMPPITKTITLMPGNNEVDPADWTELMKNSHVQNQTEDRVFEVEKDVSLKDISKLSDRKAIKVVQETYLREILRNWARLEHRPEIAKAIEEQLAKVSGISEAKSDPVSQSAEG